MMVRQQFVFPAGAERDAGEQVLQVTKSQAAVRVAVIAGGADRSTAALIERCRYAETSGMKPSSPAPTERREVHPVEVILKSTKGRSVEVAI